VAEAALRTDRVDEARARVKQVEAASGDTPGTCIAVGLRHARAVLAQDPEEAADRFDEALGADLTGWPLQRGRLLLAYGQWLRRQRRIADSRAPLRDARDILDAMGCAAWGDQARRELRASGESSSRRGLAARPANRPGASDRPARRSGPFEQGHRPAVVPVAPDNQHPPVPHLSKARDHEPR
jgi:hypothetical protein